jgi:two-component system, NtrC family, response regulator AlgB
VTTVVEPTPKLAVLVIDDEKNIRTTLSVCLEGMTAPVAAVGDGEQALAAVGRQPFDLAFLDLRLGTANGLDLIPRLLAESPGLLIVVVTAYATFETAVEAMRRGAWDYLPKPFTPHQIRHLVDKATERRRLLPGPASGPRLGGDHTLAEIETAHLTRVIARSASLDEAAHVLGIDASTLWRKRKKLEGKDDG